MSPDVLLTVKLHLTPNGACSLLKKEPFARMTNCPAPGVSVFELHVPVKHDTCSTVVATQESLGPFAPCAPAGPVAPIAPVGPAEPCGPVGPCAPEAPVAP